MAEIHRRRIPADDDDANAFTRSWTILTAKEAGESGGAAGFGDNTGLWDLAGEEISKSPAAFK